MKYTLLLFIFVLVSCGSNTKTNETTIKDQDDNLISVGANQTEDYLPLLKGKKVGIVANQTSVIFKGEKNKQHIHLVDSLLSLDINIIRAFAPEHGFRGTFDAMEHVTDGIDTETGLEVISLFGEKIKPSTENLKDIDIMIFDIQDVGVRFYTYIGTFHHVMEACAEANIPILVLDRPNPNGHYIDGPILELEYKSLVGMHPVPIIHGMTIGEYLKMLNNEHWLKNGIQCDITVIPVKNYTHQTPYSLPIKPSPNLPNDVSVNLYASLCFFEGTVVSVGRGTNKQFQIAGIPDINSSQFNYKFTPQPNDGAKHPKHEGKECYGYDLSKHKTLNAINLNWLIEFYTVHQQNMPKDQFFNSNNFFLKLAGTKELQKQIEQGLTESEIKISWQQGLENYKKIREKYLIYK